MAELPQDIADAIARCKEHQSDRAGMPVVFHVVSCDENMIFMPPTIEANDRLTRMVNNKQGTQDVLRWIETFFAEHIFWMRGQTGEGPKAALEYAKKVRNSEWTKTDLYSNAVNQLQECMEQHKLDIAKERPSAKKY